MISTISRFGFRRNNNWTSTLATKINPIAIHSQECRMGIKTKHGIIYPEPRKTSFGILRVIVTVVGGLLIGAAISKNIASFLEENELFVPSDDDDDDD